MPAMSDVPRPLEPSRTVRERWLSVLGDLALEQEERLASGPAVGSLGAAAAQIAEEVGSGIPEEPLPGGVEEAADRIRRAAEAALVPSGAGYFAFVPGTGLFASALADLVAGAMNRFTGVTTAAPAFNRLEADVIEFLSHEFGYGPDARGVLLSGGSLANLGAVVTARWKAFGDSGDFSRATVYTSAQAHHSVDKAVRLAGIPLRNLRQVAVDAAYRLDLAALRDAVAADRTAGLAPFLVVASAGTTNTGALDPLPEIAGLCEVEDLWLHVDAAYGGGFVLGPGGRERLRGIERADSITFDPHKGLFVPFGTGCLLVRDGRHLRAAHDADAHYLQDFTALDRTREAPSPTLHGPELSRSYRGLRVWLPLMLHGARAFREALDEKLDLAARFERGLDALCQARAPIEIVARAQLSTVAFRLERRDGEALDNWNARNAAWLDRINARRRVFLSSTSLPVVDGEAFTLRVCVLGARTHAEHVDRCLEDLEAGLAE